jgi:hypothetical protein
MRHVASTEEIRNSCKKCEGKRDEKIPSGRTRPKV